MKKPLNLLIIDDLEDDADLVVLALRRYGFSVYSRRVDNAVDAEEALQEREWDLALSDYSMPQFSAEKALELIQKERPHLPCIIISGNIGEEAAVKLMKSGAADYLQKDNLGRLGPAIERELREAQGRKERHKIEEQIRKLSSAVEHSPHIVMITDPRGVIEYVNPKFTDITGYSLEEALGQNPCLLRSGLTSRDEYQRLWGTILSGDEWRGEFQNKKKNGELYWEAVSISSIKDQSGAISHFIAVKEDISQRKWAEDTIKRMAYYDTLTGLPNRVLLKERLTHAMSHAQRNNEMLAIIFLDLDRFKLVNDSLGHSAGDQLLQQVAQRLTLQLRSMDTVARMGGDEFIVLLPQISHVEAVARITQKLHQAFQPPFSINGHELYMTLSIGISIYPHDGESSEVLLKNADIAMYSIKEEGRNNYSFFSPAMNSRALEHLAMESSLRRAIKQNEFVIHYQPQVDLGTGRVTGMEALLHWQNPDFGLVYPSSFIPFAEETRLIIPIGEWVIRAVCSQIKSWQAEGLQPVPVAVNLSARQFQQPNLAEMIKTALNDYGVEPRFLELEIVETTAMQNIDHSLKILRQLREIGIRIAIDDFGTGHSSLRYLKHFPLDVLKIDRTFIHNLTRDHHDAVIVRTMIDLAHGLKLKVMAEGVETQEQLDFLKAHRCDGIQGYFYSTPLPSAEVVKFIREPFCFMPEEEQSSLSSRTP